MLKVLVGNILKKKKEEESVKASYDEDLAKRLWNVSVDQTNHKLN